MSIRNLLTLLSANKRKIINHMIAVVKQNPYPDEYLGVLPGVNR